MSEVAVNKTSFSVLFFLLNFYFSCVGPVNVLLYECCFVHIIGTVGVCFEVLTLRRLTSFQISPDVYQSIGHLTTRNKGISTDLPPQGQVGASNAVPVYSEILRYNGAYLFGP